MSQPLCRYCRQPQPSYDSLRRHVELDHPAEFALVQAWLGGSVDVLRQLERVARDGMLGPGKAASIPQKVGQ